MTEPTAVESQPEHPGDLSIRAFRGDDAEYAVFCQVHNAVYPDYPESVEQLRYYDGERRPPERLERRLAEREGEVVGFLTYGQGRGEAERGDFRWDIGVLPEHRGQGVGAALFRCLEAETADADPRKLRTDVQEHNAVGISFLERRGYAPELSDWESRLDLTTFDPGAFQAEVDRAEAEGIALVSLEDLQRESDDEEALARRVEAVFWHSGKDVPDTVAPVRRPFEEWRKRYFGSINLLPACNYFALDTASGELVGVSNIWKTGEADKVEVGLTGVLRDHRRKGIATALKVRVTAAAKALGYQRLETWNETGNTGMLGINERLGFVRMPAWITYVRYRPGVTPDLEAYLQNGRTPEPDEE